MNTARKTKISACIIAFNEEDRIADCIASLSFCDEIVVVDSHSSDKTRDIALGYGARVIERDWPGHVAQKEFAIRVAANDWVLCIDADERVSDALRDQIEHLRADGFPGYGGWKFPRLSNYLGTWVRYGTWYPDLQLRLVDRRLGRWCGRDPHDRFEINDGVQAGRLSGDLLHYPYRSLKEHLDTIDRYTTIMAEGLISEGRRGKVRDMVLHPIGRFLHFYLLKRGFMLGWKGLLLACLASHYTRLKYAKLLLFQRKTKL